MEHHLVEQADRLMEDGWEEEAALKEAKRRFGNLTRHRRRYVFTEQWGRSMSRGTEWSDAFRSMVTHAVRGILRSPGLTAGVVLTLGLGIGVNTVMFSVADRLLLRPPGHLQDPEGLRRILVHGTLFGGERTLPSVTYPDLQDLRSLSEFSSVGAASSLRARTLGSGSEATRVDVVSATHDFFPTLGVAPLLGRFFQSDDDAVGAEATVVLSAEFWGRAFGRDPDILGRRLEVDGNPFTVIGVAPEGFTGANLRSVDLWLAAVPSEVLRRGDEAFLASRGSYWLQAVVRMAEGASSEVVQSRATAMHLGGRADLIEAGRFDGDTYVLVAPLIEAQGPTASSTSKIARWLLGVSLVVLLIACANVANLLLAQGTRRRRETAIRLSLGASRSRLLTEGVLSGVLLAGLGGAAALVLAQTGGVFVRAYLLPEILWTESTLPGRTVGITLALSLLAGLLAGLGPAIQSTRPDPSRDLRKGGREGTHRRSLARTTLTVAQAALSVVLLVGAGLFIKSLNEVRTLDLGLDVDRLVLAIFETRSDDLDAEDWTELYQTAADRVAGMPGVAGVAYADQPFQWYMRTSVRLPGADSLPIPRGVGPLYYSVTPGYLETLGLDLVRGRTLQESDRAGMPYVAVVNETMARALWPQGDAIGSCFYFNGQEECTTVVGVVENASVGEIQGTEWLTYYLPHEQTGFGAHGLYLRAEGDPRELAAAVAPVLRSISPSVRFADVRTLREILDPQARSWTMGAALFSGFGLLALLVAAIGLYSVLAFEVVQRTREIGIRAALGAERGQVLKDVMGNGGKIAILGCLIGLALAFLAAPYVQPLLFQVQGRDPAVLLGVSMGMLLVGSLSSLPPALRATRVDPVEALREE
jgi:predicted permease